MTSDTPLPATAEAVLTFLESVGRRSEAEFYLRLFRKIPKESFAIVAAEAPVVRRRLSVEGHTRVAWFSRRTSAVTELHRGTSISDPPLT